MFNYFEFKIGLRYLKAKQKNSFISFISLIAIVGIAIGVAALITVLSVMNGFQQEIRNKIIGITAHMQLVNASGKLSNYQSLGQRAQQITSQILATAPYIDGQAMLSFDGSVSAALIRGIEPKLENRVENINQYMQQGSIDKLQAGKFNIIIGSALAQDLGVGIGDKITLITPEGQLTPAGMMPRLKRFQVVGIFKVHMLEYDSALVLININDASVLLHMGSSISGLRLKVADVMKTHTIKTQLINQLPSTIIAYDWIDQHQNYFAAVNLEKKMMFVILTLIIAVAVFNLVSTLVMSVNEKKADIAILRTMGASCSNIRNIFIIQGGIAGIIGTMFGTIFGLLLASYIGQIVHFIEIITHSKLINTDVYLIDYLPSQIMLTDVTTIFITAITLSIIATIYPSKMAAATDPVAALRYE